jgi:hypothetical protein
VQVILDSQRRPGQPAGGRCSGASNGVTAAQDAAIRFEPFVSVSTVRPVEQQRRFFTDGAGETTSVSSNRWSSRG